MRYQPASLESSKFPSIVAPTIFHKSDGEDEVIIVNSGSLLKSISLHILAFILIFIISSGINKFAHRQEKEVAVDIISIKQYKQLVTADIAPEREITSQGFINQSNNNIESLNKSPTLNQVKKSDKSIPQYHIKFIPPIKKLDEEQGSDKRGGEIKRYEQLISHWLNEHRKQTLLSDKVAYLRIKISPNGELLSYYLERSTGDPVIDQAILTMVLDSNPFPRDPANLLSDTDIEFRIPIKN
jgi:TonB family protein